MQKKVTRLEVRSPGGELLFTLSVHEADSSTNTQPKPVRESEHSNGNGHRNGNGQDKANPSDAKMTDAQKKFLFRLLADRGYEGDQAYSHLKESFNITALSKVSKQEASNLIEKMLAASKGGKTNGSPVKQSN